MHCLACKVLVLPIWPFLNYMHNWWRYAFLASHAQINSERYCNLTENSQRAWIFLIASEILWRQNIYKQFRKSHQISWFFCIPNGSYKEDNLKAGRICPSPPPPPPPPTCMWNRVNDDSEHWQTRTEILKHSVAQMRSEPTAFGLLVHCSNNCATESWEQCVIESQLTWHML